MKCATLLAVAVLFGVSVAMAADVGYVEDFALAKDRGASLAKLIPGTEDYYYYHALHYLNTEQFEKAEALTEPWLERFGQTPRLTEIQTRDALLTFEKNPQRSIDYLRQRLNLRFDHQKAQAGGAPNLPTALDQKRIARPALLADSLIRWKNLDNFEDSALDWLAAEKLEWERRRNLLQRLQRPDIPNLPELVVEDFKAPHPVDFGSLPIHRQVTLDQLAELLKLRPELLNHTLFVQTWLTKLQPGSDEDWRHEPALTKAYLDRFLAFVRRLAPAHNALKAHVLYHRLALDRSQGVYDKPLFLEYLKLPRHQHYMAKRLLEADESRRFPADLNANFSDVTLLPIVGNDEPLVRSYLKHFLLTADTPKEFEPFINDIYLTHLFAETKIENGLGDSEVWASQLPPDAFRQLKERVDIDFDHVAQQPIQADLREWLAATTMARAAGPTLVDPAPSAQLSHHRCQCFMLQKQLKDGPDPDRLRLVHHQLAVTGIDVVAQERSPSRPLAFAARGCHLVASALGDQLALELGEGQEYVQNQPAHRCGGVELLSHRHERHVVLLEGFHETGKVEQGAAEAIDFVDHDAVDLSGGDGG
jgi:hypothetical protein